MFCIVYKLLSQFGYINIFKRKQVQTTEVCSTLKRASRLVKISLEMVFVSNYHLFLFFSMINFPTPPVLLLIFPYTALYKIMHNLSLAASVGRRMGINSVTLFWFLLMVGFGARHGNQLSSFKMVSAHLTHIFGVTVTECSVLMCS